MRELPLSVWKARRTRRQQAEVAGRVAAARRSPPCAPSTTSRASSRKISRISSSCSKSSTSVIGAIGASGTGALTEREARRLGRRWRRNRPALRRARRARSRVDRIVGGLAERVLRLQHGGGERRLVGGLRLVRQALEVARHFLDRHVFAHRA